jgi:hypothetical protein
MNPSDGQTPFDYLNQIAPQAPKKPVFELNLRNIIFGAIGVIFLIIILAVVGGLISSSATEPWQRLSARMDATVEVVDGASENIKSSQLRSINSDLKLYLTNTKRELATPLGALNINPEKLPANIVAEEKATGINERLEDGRLNAKYDSTYAREMSYQIATILSLLQKIYSSNIGPDTKTTIKSAYDNLLPTYEAVSEFSTATE